MVWCGLSWRHIIIFGFLYSAAMAIFAIDEAIDDTNINMYRIVFGLKENGDVDKEKEWTLFVIPALLVVPVIVGSGYLMMRFGRFIILMGTIALMAAFSFMLIFPATLEMFSAGFVANKIILRAIVFGGLMIYAYETVPIKYRRIALLSLSIFASFGRIAYALGRNLSGTEGYGGGGSKSPQEIKGELSVILGVASGTLLLPLVLGMFVGKDSPVSLVIRGFERHVYRYLVSWRCGDLRGPQPPMTEEDFVYQVEVERERSYVNFKTMCIRKWPALLFLFLTGYAWQIVDQVFMTPYKYLALDQMGNGYDTNPLNGLVIFNCCCLFGTLAAIVYILKFKSITILPGLSMGLLFIGSAICATVEAFYVDGNPIEYQFLDIKKVMVGQIICWIGFTLAQFLWGLLIVEIVPGTYRPIVVLAQLGFLEFTNMAIRAIYTKYAHTGRGLYIASSVILGIIALAYIVVFVGTDWFSKADPAEEDDGEVAIVVLDEEEVYLDNGKSTTLDSYMYGSSSNNTNLSSIQKNANF